MAKKTHFCIMLLLILFLGACGPEESQGCPLPPAGFSESDLIGTWDAIGERGDNTIIIRGDSRYKQIMNVKPQGFNYESDWQPWKVTHSDQGLPYLHLEGLLMCAYWDQMDCTGRTSITPVTVGNTKDPFADATYWYDFCQKKWVDTPNEGVFMVLGVRGRDLQSPRGIHLVPFTKSSDGVTGPPFQLREP